MFQIILIHERKKSLYILECPHFLIKFQYKMFDNIFIGFPFHDCGALLIY